MRKARAGTVPGTKVGRRWVFIEADLLAFIREKIKERACRSIANLRAPTGGSDSQSAASKLDARLRQLTGRPQRNSRPNFALISGGRPSSESGHDTHGRKLSSVGSKEPKAATGHGTGSA